MKFIFIGTGSAFSVENFNTNTVIEKNGKYFLIDAGDDVKMSLHAAGLSYLDIDAVFISHLHGDHSHGVEYLGFASYFDPRYRNKHERAMGLYGNAMVIEEGWEKSWRGGMGYTQGKTMCLSDYFTAHRLLKRTTFTWEDIEFTLVESDHISNGSYKMPTFGLIIRDPETGKKIFYTSDTTHDSEGIQKAYDECDIIINDCETLTYKSGVHASYLDLMNKPKEIKSKMYLQHYQDNVITKDSGGAISKEWADKAREDGFKGFLKKGTVLDVKDL